MGLCDLMNSNKSKCKVLHLGWSNSKHKNRLGREWIENRPGEIDLMAFMNENLNMTQQCVHAAQRANLVLGCIRRRDQQVKGDDCPFLIPFCKTPHGA